MRLCECMASFCPSDKVLHHIMGEGERLDINTDKVEIS